jgi:hypothetical protein
MSAAVNTGGRSYLATEAQVRDLEAIACRLQLFASMLSVMGLGQGRGTEGQFDYTELGTALNEIADRVNAAIASPGGVQ